MQVIAAIAITLFGLVIFNRGLMVVGSPVTFDTIRTATFGTGAKPVSDSQYKKGADGVVEIPLTIKNTQFSPSSVAIPANEKVRLIVDRQEENACSAQLAIPKAGVLANLTPNAVTKVDVPAMAAGSYTLTCGMGMMSGSLSVGGGAAPQGNPLVIPAALIALIAGAYGAYRYKLAQQSDDEPAEIPTRAPARGGSADAPAVRRGSRPQAQPAPGAVAFLGYQPAELAIGGVVIFMAIVIGLASGGLFR
jgi:hypothetical protein